MYSTTAYLYQQINRILLIDTSGGFFKARYNPVYAKNITINKGVDNVLLFEFVNQDQKPVNITGSEFVFRLMDQQGTALLLEKPMEVLSASAGRVKVVLDEIDTVDFREQPASYSIQRTSGDYVQAVYVDDDSGARGDARIVDSVLPQFVPSNILTVPGIYGKQSLVQAVQTDNPDWARDNPQFNYWQLSEFYSSHIETHGRALTTVQMDLDTFTGTVKFQAADDYQGVWYDVTENYTYRSETSTQYFNVLGFYPLLRAAFNTGEGSQGSASVTVNDQGEVTGVQVTYAGQGYLAAPRVTIIGNGAGARAVATVNQSGIIDSITVTASGSGYTPIQLGGTERATAVIDNGAVTNIFYR